MALKNLVKQTLYEKLRTVLIIFGINPSDFYDINRRELHHNATLEMSYLFSSAKVTNLEICISDFVTSNAYKQSMLSVLKVLLLVLAEDFSLWK